MAELAPISQHIWDMKYRLKAADGTPLDGSVEDTWRRVAEAIAEAEPKKQRARWAERFFEAMTGFRVMPAGRILAGAGAKRQETSEGFF